MVLPDACDHDWQPVGWIQNEVGFNVLDRCESCGSERTGETVPCETLDAVRADLGRVE